MKNPETIIVLINTLKTGGAEKQSILLAKSLERKYKVKLVVYYGDLIDERMLLLLKNFEIDVIYLKKNHFIKVITLFYLFSSHNVSVIISYLATTNTLNAVLGFLAGVNIRIGGIRSSKLKNVKLHIQKLLHNSLLTVSVFNNTVGMQELIKKRFNASKSIFIPNTILIPNSPVNRKKVNKITILTVGRFVEAKDYKTAIQSIASTVNKLDNSLELEYIIVGYGLLENELKEYVKLNGLHKHVEFVINPTDVDEYYKQADIYLSTSIYEGLSNSIMEAMSFNLPVIATKVGDNDKLIEHNKTGYLVNPKEVNEISKCISLLIYNDELRNEFGLKGYFHLKANFSMDKFAISHIKLIEELKSKAQTKSSRHCSKKISRLIYDLLPRTLNR